MVIYCAWEDCGVSTITVSRPCLVPSVYPFDFQILEEDDSEASFTDDIEGLPASATIPVGEYTLALSFNVPQDFIDEGTEELKLRIVSGNIESYLSVFIYDTPPLEAVTPEVVSVPCDEYEEVCVELIQDPELEYPPVSYNWTINGIDYGSEQCLEHTSLVNHLFEIYIVDGCDRTMYLQTLFEVPYEEFVVTLPNDTLLCNGASTILTLDIEGGEEPYAFQWENFSTNEFAYTVSPPVPTDYVVSVVDNCNYENTQTMSVNVETIQSTIVRYKLGDGEYEFDVITSPDEPYEGAFSYVWDFGDGTWGFEKNMLHTYDGLDEYDAFVTTTTNNGCSDVATVHINGEVIVYIPTAFTPNNDGKNDAWEIVARQVESFELFVYNRWGDVVHTSNSLDDPWIGNVDGGTHFAPDGLYNWVIKVQGYDVDAEEIRGTVYLTR